MILSVDACFWEGEEVKQEASNESETIRVPFHWPSTPFLINRIFFTSMLLLVRWCHRSILLFVKIIIITNIETINKVWNINYIICSKTLNPMVTLMIYCAFRGPSNTSSKSTNRFSINILQSPIFLLFYRKATFCEMLNIMKDSSVEKHLIKTFKWQCHWHERECISRSLVVV